jgi:PTH1 family peptidyl-tRNA hydrolase
MKVIIGLGNPGPSYVHNRHNIGFVSLNHFARMQGIRFDRKQGKARVGIGEIPGVKVVLAKPQTYMNRSGESVSRLVKRYGIPLDDLVIIHDDLDLPLGKLRLRQGEGSGGHKGIESIISCLCSQDFIRFRVGIGRPIPTEGSYANFDVDIIDYVLSDFSAPERRIITKVIPSISEAIYCLLTEGLIASMNKYN